MTRLWIRRVVRIGLLLLLGVVSFLIVNVALGTPVQPLGTDKIRDALNLDDSKARVSAKVGDVRLLDTGRGSDFPCKSAFDSHPGYDEAKGSVVAIEPLFLPLGLAEQQGGVTLCDGSVIAAARWWAPTAVGGPVVKVFRYIRPEAWVNASAPAERVGTQTIKGRTMTVMQEVVQDSGQVRGNSGVFWADKLPDGNFLVTAIYGEQIASKDLIKIAEGLVR